MRLRGVREPEDAELGIAVLRRAVELGGNIIDTAEFYGPEVRERLIAEALHPYPDGLVNATKGLIRWIGPNGRPEQTRPNLLREAVEGSLRRLRLERIDPYQLARIDRRVPAEDQLGALADLRSQGKIRYVGLSEARIDQIEAARQIVPIASVQNRFSLADRVWEAAWTTASRRISGSCPGSTRQGSLANAGGTLMEIAKRHAATPAQVARPWLLNRSPVMLPIPGTSSVPHLEENVAAAALELDEDELEAVGAR